MNTFYEIKTTHQDEQYHYIDGYKTSNQDEEGIVICIIDKISSDITWFDNESKCNPHVWDAIKSVLTEDKSFHIYQETSMSTGIPYNVLTLKYKHFLDYIKTNFL
jgi:hypothetical protein